MALSHEGRCAGVFAFQAPMSDLVHIPAEPFTDSRFVTFDAGALFDDPGGTFITVHGHPVFIGDKKGAGGTGAQKEKWVPGPNPDPEWDPEEIHYQSSKDLKTSPPGMRKLFHATKSSNASQDIAEGGFDAKSDPDGLVYLASKPIGGFGSGWGSSGYVEVHVPKEHLSLGHGDKKENDDEVYGTDTYAFSPDVINQFKRRAIYPEKIWAPPDENTGKRGHWRGNGDADFSDSMDSRYVTIPGGSL